MRTAAKMTGLSADLIRAWERRYRVVEPVRGPRGTRLYTGADIAHLRLLAGVVASGRAIGDVALLDHGALQALSGETRDAAEASRGTEDAIERLLRALERFDAADLDRQLGDALVALGVRVFARDVAAPLLAEVGVRGMDGRLSIADEHLLSGLMRNLLASIIRSRGQASRQAVLLATPSGERHEFGLLLAALHVLDAGLGLCYVGVDLPADQIVAAAHRAGVRAVGIGCVDEGNRQRSAQALCLVERTLDPEIEIWLGGRDAPAVAGMLAPTRALVLDRLSLLEQEAARLSAEFALRP